MAIVLIGIDDTDTPTSPGTGKLARSLVSEITRVGGRLVGITAHQFLVDPGIPYTGHNRGICVGIEWFESLADLDFAFDLIQEWSAEGSDPGMCIMSANAVTRAVVEWGESALQSVLTMEKAVVLARDGGLNLRALGGTGQGIIGALASIGLRAGGNNGRFVDMPGLRELGDCVTADRLAAMGILVEHEMPVGTAGSGFEEERSNGRIYKTLGWVRPRLSDGKPVLCVEWSDEHVAWVPVDRKKIHPVE